MSAMSRSRVAFAKIYHQNKLCWKRLTVYSRVQIAIGPTAFFVQIKKLCFCRRRFEKSEFILNRE